MKIYIVICFNEVDYCDEAIGYFSSRYRAEQEIAKHTDKDLYIVEQLLDEEIEI